MTNVSYTLQDFPWEDSIAAVKASEQFHVYADFYQYLLDHLQQNSPETRRRYAALLQRRFFAGASLDDLVPTVWRSYHDEQVLTEVMRVAVLEAEPVIARFVVTHVLTELPGTVVPAERIRQFIAATYGDFKPKSHSRLLLACRRLGFLGRYAGEVVVEQRVLSANALLILLHDRLAVTPRIVPLMDILAAPWYRFLGGCDAEELRRILLDAEQAGLIARYARVDELEQITTRFRRTDYFAQALRL